MGPQEKLRTQRQIHTYSHTHIFSYLHTYTHTNTPNHKHSSIVTHTYSHILLDTCTLTHMNRHTNEHTFSYIHPFANAHSYTHFQKHTHVSKFRQEQRSHGLKWSGKVAWAGNWSMSDRKTYPYICECLQAKGQTHSSLLTVNAGTVLPLSIPSPPEANDLPPSHRARQACRELQTCWMQEIRKRREASSCGRCRHSALNMAHSSALWSAWLQRMLLHQGLPKTQMPALAWPDRQGK